MARARNIKPGLYKNEDLAECSIWARYLFPGLWTLSDREGRLEDRPKRIKGELLPFDSQDVEPLLRELAQHEFIVRYEIKGQRYIQITKFLKHQTPHYSEKPSVIKPPPLQEDGQHISPQVSEKTKAIKSGVQPPDSLNPDSLNPEKSIVGLAPDVAGGKTKNGNAAYIADAEQIMSYLNRNVDKGFEFRNRNGDLTASAERIIARLKQGYTAEELREVVFAKSEQWKDDERMAEYLRPATLFAKENFEQYLGEIRRSNG